MKKSFFTSIFFACIGQAVLCCAIMGLYAYFSDGAVLWEYGLFALLIGLVPAVIVALILSQKLSDAITVPDSDDLDPDDCPAELQPLVRKTVRQDSLIQSLLSQLKRRREEFKAITETMAEGLIVVALDGTINLYNTHAKQLLDPMNAASKNDVFSLCSAPAFTDAVRAALNGKPGTGQWESGSRCYRLYADPLTVDHAITGAVILLADVTEQERQAALRREFTANVSHELKTPLTSLNGISELLENGMVKPEDMPGFYHEIHSQCARMTRLVGDITRLSQMDEGRISEEMRPLSLLEICKTVQGLLQAAAQMQQVSITVTGEERTIDGLPGLLEEMIYNLTDNAIKYNRPGGYVSLHVSQTENGIQLLVRDDGIGMEAEHLPRIFERFYRVDKSRSRSIGGTGLGLSIVKHGAAYHNAAVSIDSAPGKGTCVTLLFPAAK